MLRHTDAREPRDYGGDDTVSEQMETRHVVLARDEEPCQCLKFLVKEREARFSELRNRELAPHHFEHSVDIKHQPDRVDSSYLIGIAPYWYSSGNKACVAISPMSPRVGMIDTVV